MSLSTQLTPPTPKGLGFDQRIHKVKQYLQRGEYGLAEASLHRLQPVGKAQLRTHSHYLARLHLYRGDFSEALTLMLQAERRYGPNVNLTVDIANCRYRLGHSQAWEQRVVHLEQTLRGENLLSRESQLYGQISLGKFKEEQGEIIEATRIYLKLSSQHQDKGSAPYYSLMSQLLRVLSQGPDQPLLAQAYAELVRCKELFPQLYLEIETQHALMLAEVRQVGLDTAQARMESSFERLDVDPSDRRLLLFDLLDEFLLRGWNCQRLVELGRRFPPQTLDAYEKTLLRLADEENLSPMEWNQLPRQTSMACYLRLLSIAITKRQSPELENRWHLLMGALSPASAQTWSSRLSQGQTTAQFVFNHHRGDLRLPSHQSLNFKRRKALAGLLGILARSNRIPVETAISELWGVGFDPTYFERLRISAHRLNQEIKKAGGPEKLIFVSNEFIELAPNSRLIEGP